MCTRGVKGRGVKEGSWGGKRCPSGRLYAHPTTPSPLHTLSPLSLKGPSLNPCAQRFHTPAVSPFRGFTLKRFHLSPCTHFPPLSLKDRSLNPCAQRFHLEPDSFEIRWLYLDLSNGGCSFGRAQSPKMARKSGRLRWVVALRSEGHEILAFGYVRPPDPFLTLSGPAPRPPDMRPDHHLGVSAHAPRPPATRSCTPTTGLPAMHPDHRVGGHAPRPPTCRSCAPAPPQIMC